MTGIQMRQRLTSLSLRWRQQMQVLRLLARRLLPYLVTILIVFAGLLIYNQVTSEADTLTITEVEDSVSELLAAATPAPALSTQVYAIVLPSLVVIRINDQAPPGDSNARAVTHDLHFIEQAARSGRQPDTTANPFPVQQHHTQLQPPLNLGSGVIINESGAILTAYHLVERAVTIDITFADGTDAQAILVAAQPENNIAVLQPDNLPEIFAPATLGNPGALRIGDEAYAVGNPLGLAGSITAGVISGLDRTYTRLSGAPPLERLIQFDSAVNPGSAGGPLLNRNGEVVGIVVGPINPTAQETFIGIGFAVRIDIAGSAAGVPEY